MTFSTSSSHHGNIALEAALIGPTNRGAKGGEGKGGASSPRPAKDKSCSTLGRGPGSLPDGEGGDAWGREG